MALVFTSLLSLFVCVATKPDAHPGSLASLAVGHNGGLHELPAQKSEKAAQNENHTLAEHQASTVAGGSSSMAIVRRHEEQAPIPPLISPNAWDDDASADPGSKNLPSLISPADLKDSRASPSLLASGAVAAEHARTSQAASASSIESCDRLSSWGYEKVDECRDLDSPNAPSTCYCEINKRSYRTRFCRPAAANHSGNGEEGLPAAEMSFGYGGCDTCCVRQHWISPMFLGLIVVFMLILLIAIAIFCVVVSRLSQKSKELDKIMQEKQQQEATEAAGASADGEAAAAADTKFESSSATGK